MLLPLTALLNYLCQAVPASVASLGKALQGLDFHMVLTFSPEVEQECNVAGTIALGARCALFSPFLSMQLNSLQHI